MVSIMGPVIKICEKYIVSGLGNFGVNTAEVKYVLKFIVSKVKSPKQEEQILAVKKWHFVNIGSGCRLQHPPPPGPYYSLLLHIQFQHVPERQSVRATFNKGLHPCQKYRQLLYVHRGSQNLQSLLEL